MPDLITLESDVFSRLSRSSKNRVTVAKKKYLNLLTAFALLSAFFAITPFAEAKSATLLSIYEVKLSKHENLILSHSSNMQTGVLTSRGGKQLIVAQEHAPQSINSVKIRAQEDGVPATSIKIKKWKDRTLFYYETAREFHVYSTMGGHLVISKKVLPKFDFSKLSLLKKFEKKVARL